ncbi:polysaccharide deacetylase family protein [Panacibacter sp. DH6]|uniref:Polysaccharide deacetylase family protein n=1 Tax=Panacibacter microcysteis TaxID=2793269 RepID=A0A931DXH6_9BACT|nr:polysaccharide deacetylase family protein [Panacibacter microcysteis]MBG9374692.1 polysaccharide deacetylase family protein [Panacibacter microcysteis]
MRILFYCQQTSARLSYILDFLGKQINADFVITSDEAFFTGTNTVRINYSSAALHANELHVQPHSLLFERSITPQKTDCFVWNNLTAFFKTGGDIPFDVFAASFYLLSRYEEYMPHEKDMYGRYAHTNSLAYKENFLQQPLINLWIQQLQQLLEEKFTSFHHYKNQFTFLPTYDIDIAYQYHHHPWWKSLLGFVNDTRKKPSQWLARATVLARVKKDPFNTFDWLHALHRQCQPKPVYFFLVAEKRGLYDKNLSPHNTAMQLLIKEHYEKYTTGIHPSWQSGDDENILKEEISILENICGKNVTVSRQHYIRMNLPETYRRLLSNGITKDYSMGYGSINGFRASVASSFFWYDLSKEQPTTLEIFPFCYMEANSFFEQHLTATQAAEELQQYAAIVKKVNGLLITIFHNHFITTQQEWLPWRNMYADFVKSICGDQ